VCTTPNALHYLNTVCMLLGRPVTRGQHTMWFCSQTLKNVFRFAGYSPREVSFVTFLDDLNSRWAKRPSRLVRYLIERPLLALNHEMAPRLFGVFVPNLATDAQSIEGVYRERWHP
jgi:hypothetical protein